MNVNAILVTILTATVALAGCVSEEADTDDVDPNSIDKETFKLGNQGAISGLVVDDNYRPIQLKEDWGNQAPGDYQDIGFVLIMETAQRLETTENGEFNVLPLEPGTYTVRVAADNHEAIDKQVKVVAGEFAEMTVEARRTFSTGGSILSQEHTLFSACFANALVISAALAAIAAGCGDTSGDSSRFDFWSDYSALSSSSASTHGADAPEGSNILRAMVTEMRANSPGFYGVTIRLVNDGCTEGLGYCDYDNLESEGSRYVRSIMTVGHQKASGEDLQEGQSDYCNWKDDRGDACATYAFDGDRRFQTALFARHPSEEYVRPITGTQGAGVTFGVKAQFVQNVFLYEIPEGGIEDYCVLCEDADIPE
jgi:hypothetical protein